MHKNSHAARPHLATRVKHLDPAIRKASSDFSTPSSQLFHNGTSSSYWPFQSSVSAPLGYCWRPIRAMNFWWCFPFFFLMYQLPKTQENASFFSHRIFPCWSHWGCKGYYARWFLTFWLVVFFSKIFLRFWASYHRKRAANPKIK